MPWLCRPRTYERPVAEWIQGASYLCKGTLDQVTIFRDTASDCWALEVIIRQKLTPDAQVSDPLLNDAALAFDIYAMLQANGPLSSQVKLSTSIAAANMAN